MKIHSIDCGSLCPACARLSNGAGRWTARGRLVCHCWLVESPDGLVLVDTGLGLEDLKRPRERLGRWFELLVHPDLNPENAALRHVERLGFRREDVRHVVATHLDLDHAGALGDFPQAQVHVLRAEHDDALVHPTARGRGRYRPAHFAHGPRWTLHEGGGEDWLGFPGVRALEGGGDELLLVPLPGHTRGHTGVAVKTADGWRLHAGDAYFFHGELTGAAPMPPGLRVFEQLVCEDRARMNQTLERLRELHARRSPQVRITSAHCPVEFEAFGGAGEEAAWSRKPESSQAVRTQAPR